MPALQLDIHEVVDRVWDHIWDLAGEEIRDQVLRAAQVQITDQVWDLVQDQVEERIV